MAPAAIPLIMLAVTVASTAMSAVSQMQQAKAQESAADYNAKLNKRNADIALQQGAADAEAQRRQNIMRFGAARAAYGAAGVTGDGSPLDVLESSAINMELDRQTILRNAKLKSMGYGESATLDEMSGANAKSAGQSGAVGIILSGATKAAGYYGDYSSSTSGAATPYYSVPGTVNQSSGQYGHI